MATPSSRSAEDRPAGADLVETERAVAPGASARTPAFVVGGVALVIAIIVLVVVALAFLAWFLAR